MCVDQTMNKILFGAAWLTEKPCMARLGTWRECVASQYGSAATAEVKMTGQQVKIIL